jgi:hypothetical protein
MRAWTLPLLVPALGGLVLLGGCLKRTKISETYVLDPVLHGRRIPNETPEAVVGVPGDGARLDRSAPGHLALRDGPDPGGRVRALGRANSEGRPEGRGRKPGGPPPDTSDRHSTVLAQPGRPPPRDIRSRRGAPADGSVLVEARWAPGPGATLLRAAARSARILRPRAQGR